MDTLCIGNKVKWAAGCSWIKKPTKWSLAIKRGITFHIIQLQTITWYILFYTEYIVHIFYIIKLGILWHSWHYSLSLWWNDTFDYMILPDFVSFTVHTCWWRGWWRSHSAWCFLIIASSQILKKEPCWVRTSSFVICPGYDIKLHLAVESLNRPREQNKVT